VVQVVGAAAEADYFLVRLSNGVQIAEHKDRISEELLAQYDQHLQRRNRRTGARREDDFDYLEGDDDDNEDDDEGSGDDFEEDE
jgi:hypothetical protein